MRFGTGFDVSHIFVTHLHGDHILGIPGLIQSLDFNDRTDALAIHVPPRSREDVHQLVHAGGHQPGYPVRIHEASPGAVAYAGDDFEVRTVETDHRTRSMGFALVEDDRPGRFDRERAEELGVPVGPKFGRLHEGEAVELDDGRVIEPEQVVGDSRPGRRLVYTGDTRPVDAVVDIAAGADLLIHDATFADDERQRARHTGHSTAREAGQVAARAGAKRLALTHISSRYAGEWERLEREAETEFDGECFVASDGQRLDVPYPE